MLIDRCPDKYLSEVMTFAKRTGQLKQLQDRLDYLAHYANDTTRCILGKDFAPYSFRFTVEVKDTTTGDWKYWFNGGLIYHGQHDRGGDGGMPTLSVCVAPTEGWEIHT